MSKLVFAVVSDIHYGPNIDTKLGDQAPQLLKNFIDYVQASKPDFCVEMGDRLSNADAETERRLLKELARAMKTLPVPTYHLLGNHDMEDMPQEEAEALLGASLSSRSVEFNGYHLVFWNTHPRLDPIKGFDLKTEDLDWLRKTLAASDLPTILFTHLPLDNGSFGGNFYFDGKEPVHAAYPEEQGRAIRDVIERSGNVILCLNGHAHWNAYHGIDGTHYVTIPSLIEGFATWPEANGGYARVALDGETIDIEIFGKTPMAYRLKAKRPGHHWVHVNKDYAPKAPKVG
ncbi:MAG: metallophosphoesterase [Alphaproteobacteria bacterium]|nr:metallophosphoesterase [Alphaproteobacteria bacterium]